MCTLLLELPEAASHVTRYVPVVLRKVATCKPLQFFTKQALFLKWSRPLSFLCTNAHPFVDAIMTKILLGFGFLGTWLVCFNHQYSMSTFWVVEACLHLCFGSLYTATFLETSTTSSVGTTYNMHVQAWSPELTRCFFVSSPDCSHRRHVEISVRHDTESTITSSLLKPTRGSTCIKPAITYGGNSELTVQFL